MDDLKIMRVLESISKQAQAILAEIEKWREAYVESGSPYARGHIRDIINQKIAEAKKIIEEYNLRYYEANQVLKVNLHSISITNSSEGQIIGSLRILMAHCDSAVSYFKSTISSISVEQADKLQSLRKQLGQILIYLPEIEFFTKNIEEAITEFESGHFLASAILSSRVIAYTMDKFEGEKDEEKIQKLIIKKVIPKDRKDVSTNIMKASRLSRNFLSHNIQIFPSPSDSLSLLADSITLLQYYISQVESNV